MIQSAFFARNTCTVARDLLGTLLIRKLPDGQRISGMIVETEAYLPNDAASHAYRGRSSRNTSMFGAPGTAYVYLIYGMHYCFNVTTEAVGTPAAVLVRALQPYEGQDLMRSARIDSTRLSNENLCKGPARLAKSLYIDRSLDGTRIVETDSIIAIEQFHSYNDDDMATSTRIGVSGSAESQQALLRWYVRNHPCVSGQKKYRAGSL